MWRFGGGRAFAAAPPGGLLDPRSIPKYVAPLVIPPAMPRTGTLRRRGGGRLDVYEIAVRPLRQHVLPAGMGLRPTTVWSYGSVNHSGSLHYPAFTIEARWKRPVRVKWINGLVDADGNFRPHLLPVDGTLHWANPPGGRAGRDAEGDDPEPYGGPVPIVTHLHGGHNTEDSDGYRRPGTCRRRATSRQATLGSARSTAPSGARPRPGFVRRGTRVARCSSTRTTSAPRRCGSTTTRSA
ncbi:MAG: hypothetical protein ACM3UV_08770 [Nocardioidaceae bacterium]